MIEIAQDATDGGPGGAGVIGRAASPASPDDVVGAQTVFRGPTRDKSGVVVYA